MEKLTKREKVMLTIGLVGGAVAGVVIYKQRDILLQKSKMISDLMLSKLQDEEAIEGLLHETNELKNRMRILEEVVSEDVLEEAIATTTRKLNYRIDKVKVYELKEGLDSEEKLKEHLYFKELFEKRLKDFNELKAIRYIEQ